MMTDLRFDPSKAVTFDLAHGLVHLEGAPARLLVPGEALAALAAAAGADATAAFGRALGAPMGERVARRLAETGGVTAAPVEAVVEHLGGELALAGLGSLGLERWGRALVLVVDAPPLGGAGDGLVAAALAAAISAAAGREVEVRVLAREGARARFFAGGRAAVTRVGALMEAGASWGDAIAQLHVPATRAEGGEA